MNEAEKTSGPEAPPVISPAPQPSRLTSRLAIIFSIIACVVAGALYVSGVLDTHDKKMEQLLSHVPDTPPGKAIDSSAFTYNEFVKLKEGMSFDDVVSILGSSGTLTGASDNIAIREWRQRGAAISVTFVDGRLHSKTQVGLRE